MSASITIDTHNGAEPIKVTVCDASLERRPDTVLVSLFHNDDCVHFFVPRDMAERIRDAITPVGASPSNQPIRLICWPITRGSGRRCRNVRRTWARR